ncbi:MAG TPA: glycosyltransferase family 39 protein [Phycisphaerae bacterium]|nr:glycosyltransferase family 39 protein [Phycisphaerae bacterium]
MILLLLLATALRFHDLGGKSLWVDEANTVLIAGGGLWEIIESMRLDSSPPLLHILLHYWMKVFGDGEAAVRSLSAVFGVALVGCVFHVGRRLLSFEGGLIASALVCVSPVQVLHSQQIRMYALLPTVGLLSVYFLWRAMRDSRSRFCIAYVAMTLLGLYTHYYMLYVLPVHFLMLLVGGSLRRRLGAWSLCAAVVAVGFLPWIPIFVAQMSETGHYSWLRPLWEQRGALNALRQTLDTFAGSIASMSSPIRNPAHFLIWERLLVFGGLALWGLVHRTQADTRHRMHPGSRSAIAFLLVVPLAIALVVSAVKVPNYVPGRCDQLMFPAFSLAVAAGLVAVGPALLRYALVTAMVAVSAAALWDWYGAPTPKGDKAMAQAIIEYAEPDDAVLCTSLTRASVEYYLERAGAPVQVLSFPRHVARHRGNLDARRLLQDPEGVRTEARAVADELRSAIGPSGRFFVVLAKRPINRFLKQELLDPAHSTTLRDFGEFGQLVTHHRVRVTLRSLTPAQQ